MSDHIDKTSAAHGPPRGLVDMIRHRTEQLREAVLIPLKAHGPPLGEILGGAATLSGQVLRFCDGRPAPLAFSLTRTADDPPTFRLNVDDWPEGWTPLGVFVGQFRYWQFEAPRAQSPLEDVELPVPAESEDQPPAEGEEASKLAAQEAGNLVTGPYASLAAHGSGAEVEEPAIFGASADVEFKYRPNPGTLEIIGSLPEGSDDETLVAELRSGEETVRRAVHLDYRRPSDGRYQKNTFSFRPAAGEGDVQLVLRPLTDDDLGLLEPDAVDALLARQDYVSMPVERTDDGFVFSARGQDQRELAADASTCWAFSVATGEEG